MMNLLTLDRWGAANLDKWREKNGDELELGKNGDELDQHNRQHQQREDAEARPEGGRLGDEGERHHGG